MTRSDEIDALSTRASALPLDSPLRAALEELACLLDDPWEPHPLHGDEDYEAELAAHRADVARLERPCGANIDRHGVNFVCNLPAHDGAHNTAADGSGDAWETP